MAGEPWPDEHAAWFPKNPNGTFWDFTNEYGSVRSFESWRQKRREMLGPDAPVAKRGAQTRSALPMLDPVADVVIGTQTVVDDPPDELFDQLFDILEDLDDTLEALSPTQDTTDFFAPDDGLPIGIAFTGDWHLGASGVDKRQLRSDLDLIGATPGLYAVGMGDLVEGVNIHTKAVGAMYGGVLNDGNLQERWALRQLSRARGKWLALVSGNHDEWMKRASGVSRLDRLAQQLGARGQRPPHFCQGGGTIFAHVGTQRYVVAVTHNAKGNSRLNTSNAQRVTFDSWPQWENCDCIVCGHLHYPDLHRAYRKGGFCAYLRSGTYKLRDGYAADHGFKSAHGVPVAILYPEEKRIKAWEGDDFEGAVRFLATERQRYAKA